SARQRTRRSQALDGGRSHLQQHLPLASTRVMKHSSDRILTTHVGSLPRSQAVTDVLFARERGEGGNDPAAAAVIANAVAEVVRRQGGGRGGVSRARGGGEKRS